jgi:WD40 repeat protein
MSRLVLAVLTACGGLSPAPARQPQPGFVPQLVAATSEWQSAAVSDDGKLVLLGDQHGTVLVLDDRGRILASLEPHTEVVVAIQLRTRTTAVSASRDGSVCVLDLARLAVSRCARGSSAALHVAAFTRDGAMLAGGGRAELDPRPVTVWDVDRGDRVFEHRASASDIATVAWSRDGARLATAGHPARTWSRTGARERSFDPADHVAFTDDGLLVAARDGVLRAWAPRTGKLVHELNLSGREPRADNSVVGGLWGFSGNRVVALARGQAWIVDATGAVPAMPLAGRENDRVDVVGVSPDRPRIVTASRFHGDVAVWNAHGARIASRTLERAGITGGTMTNTGTAMLGSRHGLLSIELATGSLSRLPLAEPISGTIVDVSGDGRFAISRETIAGRDHHERLWGISGPSVTQLRDLEGWLYAFACGRGPGCRLFDGEKLVDAATGEGSFNLERWAGIAALSADGRRIANAATFDDDRHGAIVTNTTNGAVIGEVRTLHPVTALALSEDGARLLVAEGDYAQKRDYGSRIHVFDVATGAELRVVHADKDGTRALAFSPDGKRFLAGGANHRDKLRSRGTHGSDVILVDIATGATLRRLRGHRDRITSLSFSRDGIRALSVSADGTARLWNLTTGESLAASAIRDGWIVYDRDGQTPTF